MKKVYCRQGLYTHLETVYKDYSCKQDFYITEKYKRSMKTTVYVSVLLNEDQRHTALYPNTGSPSFDEIFKFPVSGFYNVTKMWQ